jgi:hypothetical protein
VHVSARVKALNEDAAIIVGANLKGGLKMMRYALVYAFLAIIMLALIYVIGMPWRSRQYRHAWDDERKKSRPRS